MSQDVSTVEQLILTLSVNTFATSIALILGLRLARRKGQSLSGYILLPLGLVALVSSIYYESSILAFIGLGLTFWGALLGYARPKPHVRADILEATATSAITTVNQLLETTDAQGNPVYLPPTQLKEFKSGRVFIPIKSESPIAPTSESPQETVPTKNPDGLYLLPPGLGLTNLYEDALGKDFAGSDIDYLKTNLPKLFVEELEIADDAEMTPEGNKIEVKMVRPLLLGPCKEGNKSTNLCHYIGCPLCSSIALALARTTGKPTIIEACTSEDHGKTLDMTFRTLEQSSSPESLAPTDQRKSQ